MKSGKTSGKNTLKVVSIGQIDLWTFEKKSKIIFSSCKPKNYFWSKSLIGTGMMSRNEIFWLVIFFIFVMPFLAAAEFTRRAVVGEASRKRRYTNIAGLAVLGFFVIVVACVSISRWSDNRNEIASTEALLNDVAEGFAKNDREIIKQWGRGGYSDSWGGPIVLLKSDRAEGYSFISKGPDGEMGTEDDISSRVHKPILKQSWDKTGEPKKKRWKWSWKRNKDVETKN